jgi:hypothetical protein
MDHLSPRELTEILTGTVAIKAATTRRTGAHIVTAPGCRYCACGNRAAIAQSRNKNNPKFLSTLSFQPSKEFS